MQYLKYFYNKNLKIDLINKFYYTNIRELPRLKKIILNSSCKTTNIKTLAANLLALELITNQLGRLTRARKSNILLKVRKGNPTGCKLILKKRLLFNFLSRLIIELLPKIKNFDGVVISRKIDKGSFSFTLKNILSFSELSEHYALFSDVSEINLSVVTSTKTRKELVFFLNSIQVPTK
jgi:large subunit ribosomal protein L5|uniref:Ribosomal protein L5 n=1 Tax=Halamphora coffeiformis TaxID=1487565 RepID=A0A2R4A3B0_9STRA|nr:ribosomal protein L5 [Halamphora coffeaeformis]AVR57523.1 ribosomal protein L5 [Halamphora coffeaeformis]